MTDRTHPLEIPEIVALVCSQIVNTPAGRQDLAALARTAKIFQDGALNGIWQWQGSFVHILRLMPLDLWNAPVENGSINKLVCLSLIYVEPRLTDEDGNQELVRPIGSADWERPLFYLHRVKTFNASTSEELPSPALFESLSSSCPREHLFPNIRSLTWTHNQSRSPGLYPCIRVVVGPRLKQLDIRIPIFVSDVSVLPDIAVKCPELADVEIEGRVWEEDGPGLHQQFDILIAVFRRFHAFSRC
ncbi:hypothetical protein DFH06DRAFT_1373009 [Mycena polygramma]|nr:hypothetical protein DFH06DRAFT_1373009 [Mycena polygramma]